MNGTYVKRLRRAFGFRETACSALDASTAHRVKGRSVGLSNARDGPWRPSESGIAQQGVAQSTRIHGSSMTESLGSD
jgi:hypothetical protein